MSLILKPRAGGAVNTRTFIPKYCHKAIGVLGTVALLLVAGDMIIHHVQMVHHLVEAWPGPVAATAVALAVGGAEVALVELVRRFR